MKSYARIENQCVAEIVSLNVKPEKLYHPSLVWVEITGLTERPDIDYKYSDGVFTAPVTEAENATLIASRRLAAEIDEAGHIIAPLQDAVDIGMATEEETARLTEWKKYRVLLSRIDVSAAPDNTWPDKPE